jgi:hypothetical protein
MKPASAGAEEGGGVVAGQLHDGLLAPAGAGSVSHFRRSRTCRTRPWPRATRRRGQTSVMKVTGAHKVRVSPVAVAARPLEGCPASTRPDLAPFCNPTNKNR